MQQNYYFNMYIHIQNSKTGPLHNMQFYIKYNMYVHAQYDMYMTFYIACTYGCIS